MDDLISRSKALDAMWKALYEYEGKTEKQFQESDELDVNDWVMNDRMWVQNGHNLCVGVIASMPSAEPDMIIRCEECIHIFDNDCPIDWNGKEFCSFAEREDNG